MLNRELIRCSLFIGVSCTHAGLDLLQVDLFDTHRLESRVKQIKRKKQKTSRPALVILVQAGLPVLYFVRVN